MFEYIFLPLELCRDLERDTRGECHLPPLALQVDRPMGLRTRNQGGIGLNTITETKMTRPGLNITTTGRHTATLTNTAVGLYVLMLPSTLAGSTI